MVLKRLWSERTVMRSGMPLHVAEGRILFDFDGGLHGLLLALTEKGRRAWDQEFGRGGLNSFHPMGQSVFTGGNRARRVDLQTGQVLAEQDLGTRVRLVSATRDCIVYWVDECSLIGLAPETLEPLWRRVPFEGCGVHEGFLCGYGRDGVLHQLDLGTMVEREPVQGPVRPGDDALRGHTHIGRIRCQFYERERVGIDEATGAVVWRHLEDHRGFHETLTVAGTTAYAGDRGLSAFDLMTGNAIWRKPIYDTGWVSSFPTLVGERLYAGQQAGGILVLDARDGGQLSSQPVNYQPKCIKPLDEDRIVVSTFESVVCYRIGV
jgi:hypothetical protein